MKPKITWVVVADARQAQIYRNEGPGRGLKAIKGATFSAPRSNGRDVYADRGGRAFGSVGGVRHAMEPPTSPEEQGRHAFAKTIAHWIDGPAKGNAFDRLILVAAPKTLGELRAELPHAATEKVMLEVDKDMTKSRPEQIVAALHDRANL